MNWQTILLKKLANIKKGILVILERSEGSYTPCMSPTCKAKKMFHYVQHDKLLFGPPHPFCHPESSEGSIKETGYSPARGETFRRQAQAYKILRYSQDDKSLFEYVLKSNRSKSYSSRLRYIGQPYLFAVAAA